MTPEDRSVSLTAQQRAHSIAKQLDFAYANGSRLRLIQLIAAEIQAVVEEEQLIRSDWDYCFAALEAKLKTDVAEAYEEGRKAGERLGLEHAAKIADGHCRENCPCGYIATEIRARAKEMK